MLLIVCQAALSFMLFILLFTSIRHLFLSGQRRRAAHSRLTFDRRDLSSVLLPDRLKPVYQHMKDLLEVTRFIPTEGAFLTLTVLLALSGAVCGVLVFRSVRGVAVLTPVCSLLPYVFLRLRLISLRLRTRLEFLPAMEVFYQQMLLAVQPNIRNTLQAVVQSERLLYPVKPSFDQLHRNLSAGRDISDALRIFGLEHGHVWADYFINMLQMAFHEGVNITSNLKELIEDMRRAQMFDQKARNRLLEIRLASFSPVFFLLLFMAINFKLNYENSVQFYFMTGSGRNMLLNAILLIFGSFMMGIYLSMKRM
ncbi:MAG: hypothetical protein K0R57_5565 [Paenibacillaceae bacterium]|jgi:Flp pilus assembly protein TadB|nr:hypothetical protein [Paenibacillaceae bacterium]